MQRKRNKKEKRERRKEKRYKQKQNKKQRQTKKTQRKKQKKRRRRRRRKPITYRLLLQTANTSCPQHNEKPQKKLFPGRAKQLLHTRET